MSGLISSCLEQDAKGKKYIQEETVKKKPALHDLEDSPSILTVCPGNKAKDVAGQPCAKEISCVTHGSNQAFQQKLNAERLLPRKYPVLSNDLACLELHKGPTSCF